ncbi:MAG: peptidyl-prolyl cis-trans isomerase C [Oleispira sp.]|jgi:peptidyl-prolyl cis-trans isomerase C
MPVAGVRHILVKTSLEANRLRDRIVKGADFAKLAKQFSQCPSGQKAGGDLGEVKPGQMVRPFDKVVFKSEIIKVHGPVKTQFGFHLIQVLYRT